MKINAIFKGFILLVLSGIWVYLIVRFPDFILFIVFIPIVLVINFSKNQIWKNAAVTIFVILWMGLFQYESIRSFYLNRQFNRIFPKTKFLFPPAGWIMFYQVDKSGGYFEVYGVKNNQSQLIDPHDIFRTRTIGYDNIHRGILGSVNNPNNPAVAAQFCRYLNYRFPYFEKFFITASYHPDMVERPYDRRQNILYQCDKQYVRF